MTANEAKRIFISITLKKVYAKRALKRLKKWDEKKTNSELMKILGFKTLSNFALFKRIYNLTCVRASIAKIHFKGRFNKRKIKILRKNGFSYGDIGSFYKVSSQRIQQVLQ